jgi:hypothetical protein
VVVTVDVGVIVILGMRGAESFMVMSIMAPTEFVGTERFTSVG